MLAPQTFLVLGVLPLVWLQRPGTPRTDHLGTNRPVPGEPINLQFWLSQALDWKGCCNRHVIVDRIWHVYHNPVMFDPTLACWIKFPTQILNGSSTAASSWSEVFSLNSFGQRSAKLIKIFRITGYSMEWLWSDLHCLKRADDHLLHHLTSSLESYPW